MGQQNSFALPIVKNNPPINFIPQTHEFQSQYIQRIKQTPFVGSILYSSQPSIYIQSAQMTIQTLLAPRMNTTKLFPKEQLIKIIENILCAFIELKQKSYEHYGNLSFDSIFYNKQTKTFKIINPAFFNSTNYLLAKQRVKFSFLSPQELLNITQQEQNEVKSFKTDIFIFAVCLLQICTLKDSRQIYCPQTYNILDVEIKQRLKNISEFYSQQLADFIELCLEYEIEKRIDLENAIKQIRFLKEKPKEDLSKSSSQMSSASQVLSPRGEAKKGSLPFGPGTLPKKLQQNI